MMEVRGEPKGVLRKVSVERRKYLLETWIQGRENKYAVNKLSKDYLNMRYFLN